MRFETAKASMDIRVKALCCAIDFLANPKARIDAAVSGDVVLTRAELMDLAEDLVVWIAAPLGELPE